MISVYIVLFFALIIFSAFFSSAETSVLSLEKIKLSHKVKKKNRKAIVLSRVLESPDEFFSTILIGNNLANIAAASISTFLFTKLVRINENMVVLLSTVITTMVILIFGEIIPKLYAFRYSEKLSYFYAYPIQLFRILFYPIVRAFSFLSNLFFPGNIMDSQRKEFSPEEIKHFLESEIQFFKYSPETLRIVHEIIDIAQKDIRNVMTPRPRICALEESSSMQNLKDIILDKKISKIPLYKDNLNNITGIIYADKILAELMKGEFKDLQLKRIAEKPVFISEYSSLNFVLKEFKQHRSNLAVILDEYGVTVGIVTLSDIFREIFEEIEIQQNPIKKIDHRTYLIQGHLAVETLNSQLNLNLPERKDYTTVSGLFIYQYGKFPRLDASIDVNKVTLTVKKMGQRRIEELVLVKNGA